MTSKINPLQKHFEMIKFYLPSFSSLYNKEDVISERPQLQIKQNYIFSPKKLVN